LHKVQRVVKLNKTACTIDTVTTSLGIQHDM